MTNNEIMKTISVMLPKGAKKIRAEVVEEEGKVNISFFCGKKEINPEEVKGSQEYIEKYFPIVRASTLSLEDDFLKHRPQTENQREFRKKLIDAIKFGLSDFRAQRMDASFDKEGNICFHAGMRPALRKSAKWWKEIAEKFMPEKESRLGTTKERVAFLGLFIKYLIEEKGYKVSDAWGAVCDQSKKLGHYWDSNNQEYGLETTGSMQVGEWYDLGNTYKIIIDDETGDFSLIGGSCQCYGNSFPLSNVRRILFPNKDMCSSVGWIVISAA